MNITKGSYQLYFGNNEGGNRTSIAWGKNRGRDLIKLDERGQAQPLSYDDLRSLDTNGDGQVGADEFVSGNLGLGSGREGDEYLSFNEYAKKTGASYSFSLHSGYMSGEIPTENTPKPSLKERAKVLGTSLLAGGAGLGAALLMSAVLPPLGPVMGPLFMGISTVWLASDFTTEVKEKIPAYNPEDYAVLPPAHTPTEALDS